MIKDAKHKLFLISPYINLDNRIQDALHEKISKHDFELLVLFGKNENNYLKSIKKDSFEFLKKFPNIEIRYNERLHAKFYQNDFDFIMTSLNLYDYSLANNIEVGIKGKYASKGFLFRALASSDAIVEKGIDKVSQDFLGMSKEVNPFEKFETIFRNSELKYKTEPIIESKGFLGGKKLNGFKVVTENLSIPTIEIKTQKTESYFVKTDIKLPETVSSSSNKTQSASQLSKSLGVSSSDINNLMQKLGLIDGDKITETGHSKGLIMKSYMGKDYIAYPENLSDLNGLRK